MDDRERTGCRGMVKQYEVEVAALLAKALPEEQLFAFRFEII